MILCKITIWVSILCIHASLLTLLQRLMGQWAVPVHLYYPMAERLRLRLPLLLVPIFFCICCGHQYGPKKRRGRMPKRPERACAIRCVLTSLNHVTENRRNRSFHGDGNSWKAGLSHNSSKKMRKANDCDTLLHCHCHGWL